jgi:hypothetical protein
MESGHVPLWETVGFSTRSFTWSAEFHYSPCNQCYSRYRLNQTCNIVEYLIAIMGISTIIIALIISNVS